MFSIAFVMVSTIAFMEGEKGTEAMVEAYSGESPTISRRVSCLCSIVAEQKC
jgi:H+/Cl- antiporter ClcA